MQTRTIHTQLPGRLPGYLVLLGFTLIWAMLIGGLTASAQVFNSGSNGSDGALNLTNPNPDPNSDPITIIFDPQALGLDPDGDNIYHFTSITIEAGVIVRLSATHINGPVFWLASGPVQIDGQVNLNGEDGHPESSTIVSRHVSVPGSGGYAGGLGEILPCGHCQAVVQEEGFPEPERLASRRRILEGAIQAMVSWCHS